MDDKFIKSYIYMILVISILNFLAGTTMLLFQNMFTSIFMGLATIIEVPLLLLSLILIFYICIKKFSRSLLILPIFFLGAYILFLVYGMITALYGNNVLDLSKTENVISFLLTDIYYLILIFLSVYILKKKKKLLQKKEENKSRPIDVLGVAAVIFGCISVIPLIGFFTGIVAIILGILDMVKNKSKLGLIGLILGILGILITIVLYGSLFYFGFVQRGGIYDEMRSKMVGEQNLPNTVNTIEAYKARFGKYPDNIEDIKQISNDAFVVIDQMQMMKNMFKSNKDSDMYFYYQNNGDTYYLFSKGVDEQPFTEDDIYPKLGGDLGNIGYRQP